MNKQIENWSEFAAQVREYLESMSYTHDDVYGFYSEFSLAVADHINNYVMPQYGEYIEAGTDMLSVSPDPVSYCTSMIERYKQRFGKNQRPYNDGRDCLKRAHYAQLRGTARGGFLPDDYYEAWEAYLARQTVGRLSTHVKQPKEK